MELRIGTNIKRLRISKGLTQEQLAELLCISTAAVSKWEAKNSYPDITLLYPLAQIFGVSIDELLGYDEAKAKEDSEKSVAKYYDLHQKGHFAEARELIIDLKEKYPHDYLVMHTYMWDKAGGNAGNRSEILLEHKEEFTQICNCILDGCSDEKIRLDALNMKGKLLHAQGKTQEAMEVLNKLPVTLYKQMAEHLFSKNTAEYRYWNKLNCYGSMDAAGIKLARIVRFDGSLHMAQKISSLEKLGCAISALAENEGLESFCVMAQAVFAVASGMLTVNDSVDDIIRLREYQFAEMEKMMMLAKTDISLRDSVNSTYKTDDILSRKIDILFNSPHIQYAELRKNEKYMAFLTKWKSRCGNVSE